MSFETHHAPLCTLTTSIIWQNWAWQMSYYKHCSCSMEVNKHNTRKFGWREMRHIIKCQLRSALVKNFRGMEQCEWLQNGFFTNQDLKYGRDFSGGELQAWMEKWYDRQRGNIFLLGQFFIDRESWATSNPLTRNLASIKPQLEALKINKFHLVCLTNRCLK